MSSPNLCFEEGIFVAIIYRLQKLYHKLRFHITHFYQNRKWCMLCGDLCTSVYNICSLVFLSLSSWEQGLAWTIESRRLPSANALPTQWDVMVRSYFAQSALQRNFLLPLYFIKKGMEWDFLREPFPLSTLILYFLREFIWTFML